MTDSMTPKALADLLAAAIDELSESYRWVTYAHDITADGLLATPSGKALLERAERAEASAGRLARALSWALEADSLDPPSRWQAQARAALAHQQPTFRDLLVETITEAAAKPTEGGQE